MPDQDRAQTAYELAELPEESTLRSVTAVPADIARRRALRVELTDEVTTVNDTERLSLTETKAKPVAGDIGLFVDIGSESFFSNLKITCR
jgi:hypothetical protein